LLLEPAGGAAAAERADAGAVRRRHRSAHLHAARQLGRGRRRRRRARGRPPGAAVLSMRHLASRAAPRGASAGVTLIELMVALAIGSFLLIGAVTVFVQSRASYRVTE